MKEHNEYISDLIYNIFTNKILKECKSIEKNEDSSDGNVYIIECEDEKYGSAVYDIAILIAFFLFQNQEE